MPEKADKFSKRLNLYRILAVIAVIAVVAVCCAQQIARGDSDTDIYLNAARSLFHGLDIYSSPNVRGDLYLYPPFLAALLVPFIWIPSAVVTVLWALISVALLGWAAASFYSAVAGRSFFEIPAKTRWTVLFLAAICTARFTVYHFRYGQANILVLALAVAGLLAVSYRHAIRGGLAIGFSIAVKMSTLPFGFWFAAKRDYRTLAGMLLAGIIAVSLPVLYVGPAKDAGYHREWIEKVAVANGPGTGAWTGTGNISLRAQLDRFFLERPPFEYDGTTYSVNVVSLSPDTVRILGYLTMLLIALVIVAYSVAFRNRLKIVSEWGGYALVFSLLPNFTPVTEIAHLVLLVPSYLYVIHLWHSGMVADKVFRTLVVASFVLLTLTTKAFCGAYVARYLTLVGVLNVGTILLSAAIYRAASCLCTGDVIPDDEEVEPGGPLLAA